MIIRKAEIGDIESLVRLCSDTLPEKWSHESFASEFKKGSVILCAEADGKIIAFCVTTVSFDDGYLDLIAVSSDYRRNGIAKAMLLETERLLNNCSRIILDVRVSSGAVLLYEACGYKTVCTRKDFYQNPREDAFTMIKEIGEGQ